VNVVVKAASMLRALADGRELSAAILAADATVRVLGPAPAVHAKIRGDYRAQLLIKGSRRRPMREAVRAALAARPDLARRTLVDVDPVSMT
jgi:primosomal protein N' (replication factor Y)